MFIAYTFVILDCYRHQTIDYTSFPLMALKMAYF